MSEWRGRLDDATEFESALDWVVAFWHVPVVAALLVFMLWNRVRTWQRFVVDGEILFSGNDPWYHYRTTTYTVKHWPATMPFDPWTNFPIGTSSGQFGTLLDQILATVALVVGLGSPSDHTIRLVVLFAPAVLGVLVALPTYAIGRRISGRAGGVTAVAVLALSAGTFLERSMVGFADHHVAEALFMSVGVLASMVAITVADREKPVFEQVRERDVAALRPTLAWSALAGVAVTLYLWVWPFGVLLIGVLGLFYLLELSIEVARGRSPEHVAFAGAVSMGVVVVTSLATIQTSGFTASDFSILHPVLAGAVAVGCVFMAWLARVWERQDVDRRLYPAAIGGIIAVGVGGMMVLTPDLYGYFANQLTRIFGLGFFISETAATVGEITPLVNWRFESLGSGISELFGAYGFAFFAALGVTVYVATRAFWAENRRPERFLLAVWFVAMLAATFSQVRFMYYLVVPVAVLTGDVVGHVADWAIGELDGEDLRSRHIEGYQVITALVIVLVLAGPLVVGAGGLWGPGTAVYTGSQNGPGQSIVSWDTGLEWMEDNTPEEGTFNGSNNRMDTYGTYRAVDDHDYEDGQYGVMSWWDYGHWITADGNRIPVANPFQQGSDVAARFLLAQSEERANEVMANASEDDAKTRYVAVDWQMASSYTSLGNTQLGGKYFAPTNFVEGTSTSEYYNRIYYSVDQQGSPYDRYFVHHSQKYYESTTTRLYMYHGSAMEPQPYVTDWTVDQRGVRRPPSYQNQEPNSTAFRRFESMEAARNYVANDTTSAIGGLGPYPSERVPAMEHYRLVGASKQSATDSPRYDYVQYLSAAPLPQPVRRVSNPSACESDITVGGGNQVTCLSNQWANFLQPTEPRWVKFFERVPGAKVQGQGPPNSTVTARVQMKMPDSNETFTYHQQAQTGPDGQFTMTLPYSTTGYDNWGPENGHTNVSVRANSSYQFVALTADNGTAYRWSDTAEVSEARVIGEDTSAVQVEMERSELNIGNNASSRVADPDAPTA